MDDFGSSLNQLSPDQLRQLLALASTDSRIGMIHGQMGQQHHTPIGTALGGIGDLLRQHQIGGLMDSQDAGRMSFADLLRGRPSQPVEGLSSPSATLPFENGPQFGPPASAFTPGATTPGLGLDLRNLPPAMDPKAKALLDALRGASGGMPAMGAMPNDVLGGQ